MALTETELKAMPDNPNVSVAEAGKDTLLSINTGTNATPTWTVVGGQRNTPLTRKANTLDASHKTSGGWETKVPGLKSWSIAYSGLQIASDDGLKALDYCYTNSKQVNVKIAYKDGSYRTGWAYITEFDDDNAHDAISTVKVTLEGVGAISDLTPAPTSNTTPAAS
jgi:TP901-1 family phage major tail protein